MWGRGSHQGSCFPHQWCEEAHLRCSPNHGALGVFSWAQGWSAQTLAIQFDKCCYWALELSRRYRWTENSGGDLCGIQKMLPQRHFCLCLFLRQSLYIGQAVLDLRDPPAPATLVLGLNAWPHRAVSCFFFFWHLFYFYMYLIGMHVHHSICMWKSEDRFSPFTMWILGIEFRLLGLVASTFIPTELSHQFRQGLILWPTEVQNLQSPVSVSWVLGYRCVS